MSERIAIVGVGRMGGNIARRLKEVGHDVVAVFDTNSESAAALAKELGCEAPGSLPEVTSISDIVITVVTDDASMYEIFDTENSSLLSENASGKLFINCATLSPQTHIDVEKRAKKVDASTLEACMASSITQAREGSLYLMCGGQPDAFDRAKPILENLSSSLRYIGPSGEAAKVKALVNMVMNINTAALAEGLALGHALGLDLTMLREVFAQTGANSRVLETDSEDMVNRDFDCYFSAAHAAKDSGIANQLAEKEGLSLPLSIATESQYREMISKGLGELDKSGIAELTFKR